MAYDERGWFLGRQAIAQAAHDLTRWLGDVRITPRFRTPVERELSA
jgi:hypothetical protein